jgi:hypothetical protein
MATVVQKDIARRRIARDWRMSVEHGLAPVLEPDGFVLKWGNRKINDLDMWGALISCTIERTIDGGSTLSLSLADPDGQLFSERARRMQSRADVRTRAGKSRPVESDERSEPMLGPDVVGGAVELVIDGVAYRLVKVRYSTSTQIAELVFEDRIVYLLKRKRGAKRANRQRCTRAEFILALLREVKIARYRFVCPDLHTRQPIETSKTRRARGEHVLRATTTSSRRGDEEAETAGGFAPNVKLTVKGVRATPDQRRNLTGVLRECSAQGASTDVMVATVCCVIHESRAKRLGYGDAAGPDSRGLFQQRAPWGPVSVRLDPRGSTRMFLTGGKGGQQGYKQKHGSLKRVPGGIENAVKAVQISVGGYAQHEREARHIVNAYRGGGEGDAAMGGTYAKSYQFARGPDEDSWTAGQRLAGEVGWRLFVVGNSVYYMSEADLYARRSRYEITPEDPAILDLAYDIDWGKPVSEMSLTVALDRWGAPPGAVVNVAGYGPPDGRWLIVSTSRDYFEPTATVTLRQPGKELLEPASERVQRAANASTSGEPGSGATGSPSESRVLAVARAIDRKSYPYVWGGGHSVVGRPDGGTGRDAGTGYDCSGATAAVLGELGLGVKTGQRGAPIHSSQFGSLPGARSGRGSIFTVCFNSGHVYIRFEGGGRWTRFDTSSWSGDARGRGARLRTSQGAANDSGYSLCHWEGW